MKHIFLMVAAGLAVAAVASAQDPAALAQAKGCMKCHAVEQKKVAASFKAIAANHAGDPTAAATLIAMLKNGSDDHQPAAASDAEIKALVDYILALK